MGKMVVRTYPDPLELLFDETTIYVRVSVVN